MNKIIDAFLGLAVGDALGVPVEFISREELRQNPVTDMRAFGTHKQPAGTWSDDASLTFCLADALCSGYDLEQIGRNFVLWYDRNFWAARFEVFDVGISTAYAINRIIQGVSPKSSGNTGEDSNGNGSLMRILPLAFYLQHKPIRERFEHVAQVSAITHAHIRSVIACFIYTEFAAQLLQGFEKMDAYRNMQKIVNAFLKENEICDEEELRHFHRILENPYGLFEIRHILDYQEDEISSRGYVIDTLEAAIWCFLKFDAYPEIVLKAVNLGSDTDTTGCVAGGLAGLYYGCAAIPEAWLEPLARKREIIELAERFSSILQ